MRKGKRRGGVGLCCAVLAVLRCMMLDDVDGWMDGS